MSIITYGRSTKVVDNAKTRRHARRRAAAMDRESIESIIDEALGIEAAPVVAKHMSRIEKAVNSPSLRGKQVEGLRVKFCSKYHKQPSVYGRLSGNGRQRRPGKSIPLVWDK